MAQKIITSQFCVTSVDDGRDGENGENGTSPWVADFDNEMDSVQCDDSGYVLEEQTVYTNVRLFYGNNAKMLTIVSVKRGSVSMGNGTEKNGVTVTWGATSSSVGISFKYKTTAKISGKDNYEIVLRSYDGESQNKTLYFTVNGVRGDVYNLLPSVDEIHATRDASGNYLINGGNTFVLTCGYSKRNLNGNVTRVTDVSEKIDNKYNIYFNRHKRNGDWATKWALYQNYKYALAMPGTTIDSNTGTLDPATYDAIRFALCESTSSQVAVSTGLNGIIDEETVCIVSDGGSSIRIDLDNEADMISVDSNFKVRFARTITVKARIFEGGKNVTSGVTHSMTDSGLAIGDCTPTLSFSKGVLTIKWAFTVGMNAGATTKTISLTYGGETYSTSFVLGVTVADSIWQVLPSPTEVSFSLNSSTNKLTPSSIDLYCGYTKSTGNGTETVQKPTKSSLGNSKYLYYRTKTSGSFGNWTAYTGKITVQNTTTVQDYEFCISSASAAGSVADENIIDRECVPVIKDGINGSDGADGTNGKDGKDGMGGVVATVTPDKVYAPCNCLGAVVKAVSQTLTFSLKAGATSVTVTSVTNNSKPTGVSVADVSGSNNKKKLSVEKDAASSNFSGGAVFTVSGTYNGSTISAQCTVAIVAGWQGEDGTDGNDGHVGRWYEYKGSWGAGSVTSVTNTKHVGYFVKYVYNAPNYHYYINIKDDGVANTTTPADGTGKANSGWEQISDDRMAIFSKVIFSDNAYLGSFIINSDWMISQQAASGSPQSSYTKFNPSYPNSNHNNSNFIPVLAINGRTGKIYMNDAVVRGSITATSGSFTGTVYANNGYFKGGIYNPLLRINSGTITYYAEAPASGYWRITSLPSNCGGFQFEMTSKVFVYLPAPDSSWNGREFEIVNLTEYSSADVVIQTSNAYGPSLTLKQYFYVKFKVVYDPVAQEYRWIKISSMNVNRGLATGDTEDGAHVEFGNVVTT